MFKRDCEAAGIPVDEFVGNTFVGHAAIIRDNDELALAIRATTVSVNFEPFPQGGWLLFEKKDGEGHP